jgi:hypothetical protein
MPSVTTVSPEECSFGAEFIIAMLSNLKGEILPALSIVAARNSNIPE